MRLSLLTVFCYFAAYLALHILIAVKKQNLENNVEDTKEYKEKIKVYKFLHKWFPAIYVLFLILVLY